MVMAAETEKITVNLGPVDLGQIDLLVQEGFYSNRTDFIRTAIRNQLTTHAETVKQTVARKTLVLGLQHYSRQDLEAISAAGQRVQINVLGLASIADDVSPELALATIDAVVVLGAFRASDAVAKRCQTNERSKETEAMDDRTYAGMAEATRLTREGRLNEATLFIQ